MRVLRWLDKNFEPLLMAITFFLVCGLIFVQVVLRFIFNTGFSWGEEIARYLFVWSVFVSVPYISRNNKHVGVSFLRDMLPDKLKKMVAIITDILAIVLIVVMLKYSWSNVQLTNLYQDRATSVDISMNWLYMAPVVGFALMLIRTIQTLVWKIRRFNCSFDLFINPGGVYSGSFEMAIATGRNREELKGNYDPECAREEVLLHEKGGE